VYDNNARVFDQPHTGSYNSDSYSRGRSLLATARGVAMASLVIRTIVVRSGGLRLGCSFSP